LRLTKALKAAVSALEDIKARDIKVLDTRKLTSMYDALIIATSDSARQSKALARHVHEQVKAVGGRVLSTEGEEGGEWVLVDCADFVVHIMHPAARALYDLESLWTAPTPTRKAASKTKAAADPNPAPAPKRSTRLSSKASAASTPANKTSVARKKPAAKIASLSPKTRAQPSTVATAVSASKKPVAKPRARRRLPD
jgi:iojap-related protein